MRAARLRPEKRIILWSLCSLLIGIASCDSCGSDAAGPDGHLAFSVDLVNHDVTMPVNIFALNETFPCCQVQAGDFRTVSLSGISVDGTVRFAVGRNGQIFKTVDCRAADSDPEKFVVWTPTNGGGSTGAFRCEDW